MSFPDFSLIKFVTTGTHSKPPGETINLYKFFSTIANKHKLEVNQFQLVDMFMNDLAIDTKKYDKALVGILEEALIYYTTKWPGWESHNDYYAGKIKCSDWYQKFKNYLAIKTVNIIKKYEKCKDVKDAEVQVDLLERDGDKRVAPYTLCIGGSPCVLNNVVFVENGGSIFLKQHAEKPWPVLQKKQMLNWPYVTVKVKLPDIMLTRANTHQMPRYLARCNDITVFPEVNTIKHIKKIPKRENEALQPYSLEFFSLYFDQLIEVLVLIPGICLKRLEELRIIFKEFLSDIEEVNLYNCTMCPYVSVAYHIGKCKYIRNKKVGGNSSNNRSTGVGLNFYEIVIPQIEFSLDYFNVKQDGTDTKTITFASLNKLKLDIKSKRNNFHELEKLRTAINTSAVFYECTLCKQLFCGASAYENLNEHFKTHHKSEQTLLCHVCKKPFEVEVLTVDRWKHSCIV